MPPVIQVENLSKKYRLGVITWEILILKFVKATKNALAVWNPMRLKINGFILLFTRADHGGRHIHVFKDNRELGVYDRIDGPIRGLEAHFGKNLREALDEFIALLNECGLWIKPGGRASLVRSP